MGVGVLPFRHLFRRGFYLAYCPYNLFAESAFPDRVALGEFVPPFTLDRLWPSLRAGSAHRAHCSGRITCLGHLGMLPIASQKTTVASARNAGGGGVFCGR